MTIHEQTFATFAEAVAFLKGVALVNDSTLSSCAPVLDAAAGTYCVYVHDEDVGTQDTCPGCGLSR